MRRREVDRYGEPLSKLARLRKQAQAPLDLMLQPAPDERYRKYVVTHIETKGGGWVEDNSGICIWLRES